MRNVDAFGKYIRSSENPRNALSSISYHSRWKGETARFVFYANFHRILENFVIVVAGDIYNGMRGRQIFVDEVSENGVAYGIVSQLVDIARSQHE